MIPPRYSIHKAICELKIGKVLKKFHGSKMIIILCNYFATIDK
jgi:hypothetical protein